MNPTLIGRYIFRNLAVTTVFLTVGLTLAMWLIKSLKLLEIVINGGAPLWIFLSLVALAMPTIIMIVLPIALFFAIAFIYNKLTADSELIVLRAMGLSQWRLARPAMLLGIIVAVLVFLLNAFISPWSQERSKNLEDLSRAQYNGVPLNEGVFNAIGDTMTVYVREREPNGDLHGIVIYQEPTNGRPVTTVAKRGVLAEGDQGPEIIVYDVSQQEVDLTTGRPRTTEFAQGVIPLQAVQEALTARWKEPSERTLPELLAGKQGPADEGHDNAFRVEAHNRMASGFFSLALTAVGIAALLGGRFDRRGQSRRILIGFIIMLMIEISSIGLSGLAHTYEIAIPLLYLAATGPIAVGLVMFARANDGLPPWRHWLSHMRPWRLTFGRQV